MISCCAFLTIIPYHIINGVSKITRIKSWVGITLIRIFIIISTITKNDDYL